MTTPAPPKRKMSDFPGTLGLERAWKGFRSTVSLRQNSLSETLVDAEHRDPNGLKCALLFLAVMLLCPEH